MQERYKDVLDAVTTLLTDAIIAREEDLEKQALGADVLVRRLVLLVGLMVVGRVLAHLSTVVVGRARRDGMGVDRKGGVRVMTVLGAVSVASPYLRDRGRPGRTSRPVYEALGLKSGTRTPALERALVDFGAEESFARAAVRLEEHYGFTVGRTSILRVVHAHAASAEEYCAQRLAAASADFEQPLAKRRGVAQLVVQLDGCEIRTGKLQRPEHVAGGTGPAAQALTPVRDLPRGTRPDQWRDVRVGLARALDEVDRTYVARMAPYPEVVGQLFGAAVDRGMSERTTVIAVADGGNGLREELDAQFANLNFILDNPHLRQHLYETAEAMGFDNEARRDWVTEQLALIDPGNVRAVIEELRHYEGDRAGAPRVQRLVKHLERFHDAVGYDDARAKGWPIASGEVESSHRYVVQRRLKLPGACWHPDSINPFLALRALRYNGWWDDFWDQRAPRTHAA